jgi:hypothetical protein
MRKRLRFFASVLVFALCESDRAADGVVGGDAQPSPGPHAALRSPRDFDRERFYPTLEAAIEDIRVKDAVLGARD